MQILKTTRVSNYNLDFMVIYHDLLGFRFFENIFLAIMIKTASSPTNILPKYYIIRYKQQKLTLTQKPTTKKFHLLNLFQVCPFVTTYAPAVSSVLKRFDRLFLCFTQFGGSSYC